MANIELPVHDHPLTFSARFQNGLCKGCGIHGYFYESYICNELYCDAMFHKECGQSLLEINHPSHRDHLLKLDRNIEGSCNSCGRLLLNLVIYRCSVCDFKLDLGCARGTLLSHDIQHLKAHEHPLILTELTMDHVYLLTLCKACNRLHEGQGIKVYACLLCNVFFHIQCVGIFPEFYHPSHPKHPLKFLKGELPVYCDGKCCLCGVDLKRRIHHCGFCNFSICYECAKDPPPINVLILTTHEHQLHLVPRHVVFTCNACGTQGDRSPYFCFQCNFMIHRECIDLPRVININRHDHRVSYTCYLGPGDWTCGVCRKKMNGFYGAFQCSKCFTYAVHSRCATRRDVWDNIELEMIADEDEIPPFEVVDDNIIRHFSHHHNLRQNKDGGTLNEDILCKACAFQVYDDPFYGCEQCDFILHETCANFPRKKRHVSYTQPFTLQPENKNSVSLARSCSLCQEHFTGFKYVSDSRILDIRCGSFFEPFIHESHPHPLYFDTNKDYIQKCVACGVDHYQKMLTCDECTFGLHFGCAFLPKKVMKIRYDDHPLYLSYGEHDHDVDAIYWCDVCETKLDPKKWLYKCDDCGVTLHVKCVVRDFSYHIPGKVRSDLGSYEIVPNNSINRPFCYECGSRCTHSFILSFGVFYFCSEICFNDT